MQTVLRNRSIWIIGLAESVSGLGTWITMMALFALVMFEGEGTVAHSSAIMLAGLAPMLLLGPAAGWLADRFDRKRLMIASQLLTALPVAGLMIVGNTLWLYPLLMLHTVCAAVMMPARQASVPQLVARDDLTHANALLQQLASFVKIGAPILSGVVVAALGAQRAMQVDIVSFGAAALILTLLPALPPGNKPNANPEAASEIDAPAQTVWRTLRHAPALQLLFLVTFLAILIVMGFDVLSAIVVRDMLQGDERLFGLLIGLIGFGSVLAGLALMMRKQRVDPWRDVIVGLALLAVLPLSIALAGVAWPGLNGSLVGPQQIRLIIMIGCLIGGLGNGLIVIQIATLLQLHAPAELLGRVSGVFQSVITAAQLISIVLTPLIVPALLALNAYFGWSALLLGLVTGYAFLVVQRRVAAPEPVDAPEPIGAVEIAAD